MPQLNINGVEVTMTVAEFVEYQKLTSKEPVLADPPVPEPESVPDPVDPVVVPQQVIVERIVERRRREYHGNRNQHVETRRRRDELQEKGYKNVHNVQSALTFLAVDMQFEIPDSEGFDLTDDEERHRWLMAGDNVLVERYNAYSSGARTAFNQITAGGRGVWSSGLIAALLAIEIDYGTDVAWIAFEAMSSDLKTREVILNVSSVTAVSLSPDEQARARLRLPVGIRRKLYGEFYNALIGGAERSERQEHA